MSQSGTMRILQAIHFELKFIKMDRIAREKKRKDLLRVGMDITPEKYKNGQKKCKDKAEYRAGKKYRAWGSIF